MRSNVFNRTGASFLRVSSSSLVLDAVRIWPYSFTTGVYSLRSGLLASNSNWVLLQCIRQASTLRQISEREILQYSDKNYLFLIFKSWKEVLPWRNKSLFDKQICNQIKRSLYYPRFSSSSKFLERRLSHVYSANQRCIDLSRRRNWSSSSNGHENEGQRKKMVAGDQYEQNTITEPKSSKTATSITNKNILRRLPAITHIHRPTKEELLAAATGFWSRLKVRFKWFSIRSVRPFNVDEIGAFFSWFLLGHVLWIVLGTTTFFSLAIFAVNTVFAQGMTNSRLLWCF